MPPTGAGLDYLRDNMVQRIEEVVNRSFKLLCINR